MAVSNDNILIGPCKIFKVDGNDIGATAGGVDVNQNLTITEVMIDQVPDTMKTALTGRTRTVHTQLAEATLANLQIAWALTAPASTDIDGNNVLNISAEKVLGEHTLLFVGPAPGDFERTVLFHRSRVTANNPWTTAKDKPQLFDVTFTIYPDFTQPQGEEYGTVSDSTTIAY